MATFTHLASTASTVADNTYTSDAFVPAVGDLLVVFAFGSGTVGAGTCTSSGMTFAQITTATKATSADTLYAYVANSLIASAVSRTITITTSADNATGATIFVAGLQGANSTGSGTVRQFQVASNQTAGTTPTLTFPSSTAALTANALIGCIANATNPATVTQPSSWTEGSDTGYDTPTQGQEYAYRNSGHTSANVTWGSSPSGWCAITMEITAAASTVDKAGSETESLTFETPSMDVDVRAGTVTF